MEEYKTRTWLHPFKRDVLYPFLDIIDKHREYLFRDENLQTLHKLFAIHGTMYYAAVTYYCDICVNEDDSHYDFDGIKNDFQGWLDDYEQPIYKFLCDKEIYEYTYHGYDFNYDMLQNFIYGKLIRTDDRTDEEKILQKPDKTLEEWLKIEEIKLKKYEHCYDEPFIFKKEEKLIDIFFNSDLEINKNGYLTDSNEYYEKDRDWYFNPLPSFLIDDIAVIINKNEVVTVLNESYNFYPIQKQKEEEQEKERKRIFEEEMEELRKNNPQTNTQVTPKVKYEFKYEDMRFSYNNLVEKMLHIMNYHIPSERAISAEVLLKAKELCEILITKNISSDDKRLCRNFLRSHIDEFVNYWNETNRTIHS